MNDMGTIQCSKAQAIPLIIGKDTVYVHTDIVALTIDSMGNLTDNLYSCHEIQYDKDEYIQLMSEKINPTIDIENCTLEELKAFKIKESKENLSKFLKENYLVSTCHKGIEQEYSITEEKQGFLKGEILLASGSTEYQPSWNTRGGSCTYDWTLAELMQLAYEMSAFIKPKISHQQDMEESISKCLTKEDILAIDITF